ncbi:MAG: hypothetical protein HAW67_07900 [Endozoicomonadaceae bacterium]|nr:hypothetical protein [Endozoicomonadaceae bacterium]
MLFSIKISIALGCVLIGASSFCTVSASNESRVKNLPIASLALQAVIDPVTGYFIKFKDDRAEKLQDITSGSEYGVYSKKRSTIDGGGVILTMGDGSFPQMRVIKDKESVIHTQCSSHGIP